MSRARPIRLIVVFAGLGTTLPAVADADRGAQLAATCAACHRLDGHQSGTPSIVGRSTEQLVDAMTRFRDDSSVNHVMRAVSRAMSPEEIEIVGHYLSTMGQQAERP